MVLAAFVGFLVISKVPNTLHTPLMSGTNAIHGIVAARRPRAHRRGATASLNKVLLVIAIAFGTINIVGGFLVTDRMLEMFKGKQARAPDEERLTSRRSQRRHQPPLHRRVQPVHHRAWRS